MTTAPTTTSAGDLSAALDRLAAAAEQACDDARTRAVLAVVVHRLEDAAGAWLGDTDGDALVVLQRRYGRAHARLLEQPTGAVDADLLCGLAQALRPHPDVAPRAAARTLPSPAFAGC